MTKQEQTSEKNTDAGAACAQIICADLALGYEGTTILEHISFTVNAGEYLCILGDNGSGKTTLMKTLLGLHSPRAGRITFCGGLKQTEIGYLPQQTQLQQDFPASVREVVLSGCQGRLRFPFVYGKKERRCAQENMERMGIAAYAGRACQSLSGGQKQRVFLARALCATEKLLVLDEPVSGLDPQVTEEMYELIEGLHREGITILMISHDVEAAGRYATQILHIGNTFYFGSKEDYFKKGNFPERSGK